MKRIEQILGCILLLNVMNVFGQAFQKGNGVLNIGMGLGGYVRYWGGGYSSTPYFNVSFDYGVYDFEDPKNLSIGIGAYLGYKSVSYTWYDAWWDKQGRLHINEPVKQTWTYINFGIRPSVHYSFDDKAQVYGGFGLGYVNVSYKYSHPDYYYYGGSYGSYVGITLFAGGRYYFSKSLGAFAELGYGLSYLNLGISLKF